MENRDYRNLEPATGPEPGGLKGEDGPARFDYDVQAWVQDGRYVSCSHPEEMGCQCYGKVHAGEPAELLEPEYGEVESQ